MTKETKPKKPRVDKIKTQAKIMKEVIKDPLADQRTIAKRAWVSKTSVHNNIKELDQMWPKIKAIEDIIATDATIVQLAQMVIVQRLQNPEKEKTRDIISAASESAKRYALFKWDATDNEWGLKDTRLSDKQIDAINSIFSALWKHE